MLSRRLLRHAVQLQSPPVCVFCAVRPLAPRLQQRLLSATALRHNADKKATKSKNESKPLKSSSGGEDSKTSKGRKKKSSTSDESVSKEESPKGKQASSRRSRRTKVKAPKAKASKVRLVVQEDGTPLVPKQPAVLVGGVSIKDALLGTTTATKPSEKAQKKKTKSSPSKDEPLPIATLTKDSLHFEPLDVAVPPVPMLGYGLDRVLFNAGVYRLQDPRSRVYNFDPYLEEIMPVQEFDFDALTAYKTSSQDESLLAITKEHGTKFTGSTSSMSGVLSQFHHLISGQRLLNHKMLSQTFVAPSNKFSKVSRAPTSIFLRRKNGVHAIDADKSFDSPNVMSWLGHSMEKLLTTTPEEFEKFRRSNAAEAPKEDGSARCFHYSKQGNFLIRSQLDAYDPRLPGAGIFDVKTRAVVSIRMNAEEYETGLGYQLRYDHGEWESYEREFYDMSRATMLKYSLQVRMGRMDGIFVAYHNIERMFGFQYLSLADMDRVLHGQTDPCLGDQEFKMSVHLFDEVLQRATERFPDNEIRLTFHVSGKTPSYMAIIAEPFTSEEVDNIQASKKDIFDEFKWKVVGGQPDESKMQSEWRDIQERVNEELISEEATEQGEDEEAITNDVNASNVEEQPKGEEPSGAEAIGETAREAALENDAPIENDAATGAQMTEAPAQAEKPIMGWTLTVRNRVNGNTTDRPENLEPSDDWALEYFLQEIPEEGRGKVHANLQKSIMSIFGQDQAARDVDLRFYRQKIQKWTDAGRRWQEEQKEIDEKMGKQIYRPLGPGSEAASTPVSSQDK